MLIKIENCFINVDNILYARVTGNNESISVYFITDMYLVFSGEEAKKLITALNCFL